MKQTVEWLENGEDHSFYLIGDSDRRSYYPAIIGISYDSTHVAYSREKLIRCFVQLNDWPGGEAEAWVEYNVERALPYYDSGAPVILNNNFISSRNKTYIPLQIVS